MTQVTVPKPKLILCDIEGTTTAITFVKDVLFPFVRANLRSYLESTWTTSQTVEDVQLLWDAYQVDLSAKSANLPKVPQFAGDATVTQSDALDAVIGYVNWQMDLDRKTTSLKQLQGHMWLEGYQSGKLQAHVYAEVPAKFQSWTQVDGIPIGIYSSGSVLAQKLLFTYTTAGDLTKYISHYFDTQIGAKQETASYHAISSATGLPAGEILFLTDIPGEARAAQKAGMGTILLTREGNELAHGAPELLHVDSFDEIAFA